MEELQIRVQNALEDDSRTGDAAIDIINNNGVITLTGIAREREISEAAEAITKDIQGVVSVINEIQVRTDTNNEKTFNILGTVDEDIIVK